MKYKTYYITVKKMSCGTCERDINKIKSHYEAANHYYDFECYEEAEKRCLLGIEKGDPRCMVLLASLYKHNFPFFDNESDQKKKKDLCEKYLLMAKNLKHVNGIILLAEHYIHYGEKEKVDETIKEAFMLSLDDPHTILLLIRKYWHIISIELQKLKQLN